MIKNKKDIPPYPIVIDLIKALLHEYRHYLQPRSAEAYYYDLGFTYENNPMELEAISEEQNYKLFE